MIIEIKFVCLVSVNVMLRVNSIVIAIAICVPHPIETKSVLDIYVDYSEHYLMANVIYHKNNC